jgi:hypothetical protein
LNLRARILWLALTIFLAGLMLALSGCATQPAPGDGNAGFLHGVLHGLGVPLTLPASFFLDIRIYAFPNSGVWYDCGFVAGVWTSGMLLSISTIARIGGLIATGRLRLKAAPE